MMSCVLTRLKGVFGLILVRPFFQESGNVEGLAAFLSFGAGEHAGHVGEGGDGLAGFGVAFHHAVGEAQGEGGVGVVALAFDGVAGGGEGGLGLLFDFALGIGDAARGAGVFVHEAGELDHGVLGGVHGGLAALVEFLAEGEVADLGAVDQFRGAGAGGFAGEDFLHDLGVGAHLFGEGLEAVGHADDFEVLVDGFLGEEGELEGAFVGVGILGEALAVGLGALDGGAHQAAGDGVGLGEEGLAAFKLAVGDVHGGGGPFGPRRSCRRRRGRWRISPGWRRAWP